MGPRVACHLDIAASSDRIGHVQVPFRKQRRSCPHDEHTDRQPGHSGVSMAVPGRRGAGSGGVGSARRPCTSRGVCPAHWRVRRLSRPRQPPDHDCDCARRRHRRRFCRLRTRAEIWPAAARQPSWPVGWRGSVGEGGSLDRATGRSGGARRALGRAVAGAGPGGRRYDSDAVSNLSALERARGGDLGPGRGHRRIPRGEQLPLRLASAWPGQPDDCAGGCRGGGGLACGPLGGGSPQPGRGGRPAAERLATDPTVGSLGAIGS